MIHGRICSTLQTSVNWGRYLGESTVRKVKKTNNIQYKQHLYDIPSGYANKQVHLYELNGSLKIYHRDTLLCEYTLQQISPKDIAKGKIVRVVSKNGTIGYKGVHYYIDYRFARKTIVIKERAETGELLFYYRRKDNYPGSGKGVHSLTSIYFFNHKKIVSLCCQYLLLFTDKDLL
ncbi:MAG: hypothetical protein EU535_03115 [Promethearchaeota archaeon]|nr:MAG: hypothetical protein EU535_03115 [Candidatus Lokiarchaeota archaeon]